MSQTDSFIDEVSEEIRRDRLFKVYKKYGWVLLLLVLGIVGGAAWNEYAKAERRAASEAAGQALSAAVVAADPSLLDDLAAGGSAAAVVARLQQAAMLVELGETAAAADILRALSADMTLSRTYRELAQLKLVIVAGADLPEAELLATLDLLAQPGAPYRMLAVEQRALFYVRTGDIEAALRELSLIVDAEESTAGLRQRAQELTIALGGSFDTETNG